MDKIILSIYHCVVQVEFTHRSQRKIGHLRIPGARFSNKCIIQYFFLSQEKLFRNFIVHLVHNTKNLLQ